MARVLSIRPHKAVARVQSQASSSGICGEQSGIVTAFSPSVAGVRAQYRSAGGPQLFVHTLPASVSIQITNTVSQYTPPLQLAVHFPGLNFRHLTRKNDSRTSIQFCSSTRHLYVLITVSELRCESSY
jgi:hypothetical protein